MYNGKCIVDNDLELFTINYALSTNTPSVFLLFFIK